jgi:hypothetical protein
MKKKISKEIQEKLDNIYSIYEVYKGVRIFDDGISMELTRNQNIERNTIEFKEKYVKLFKTQQFFFALQKPIENLMRFIFKIIINKKY